MNKYIFNMMFLALLVSSVAAFGMKAKDEKKGVQIKKKGLVGSYVRLVDVQLAEKSKRKKSKTLSKAEMEQLAESFVKFEKICEERQKKCEANSGELKEENERKRGKKEFSGFSKKNISNKGEVRKRIDFDAIFKKFDKEHGKEEKKMFGLSKTEQLKENFLLFEEVLQRRMTDEEYKEPLRKQYEKKRRAEKRTERRRLERERGEGIRRQLKQIFHPFQMFSPRKTLPYY